MAFSSQNYNCSVTWIIDNISAYFNWVGDFCKPDVPAVTTGSSKWLLKLARCRNELHDLYDLGLCIQKPVFDNSEPEEIIIDYRVCVVAADGSLHFCKVHTDAKFAKGDSCPQVKGFAPIVDILDKSDLYTPKDSLTLKWEVRLSYESTIVMESTVRTKIMMEKYYFVWPVRTIGVSEWNATSNTECNSWNEPALVCSPTRLKVCPEAKDNLCFPLVTNLEKTPKLTLLFPIRKLFEEGVIELLVQIQSKRKNRSDATPDCALLLSSTITLSGDHFSVPFVSSFVFCESLDVDDPSVLLLGQKQRGPYDPERDVLNFECNFGFSDGSHTSLLESMVSEYPTRTVPASLSNSKNVLGKSLLHEQKFCDVTLKAGDKTFKAHKAILSSVSPVFDAMFEHDMKESNTGIVLIDGMDSKTLNGMLQYIYTNSFDDSSDFKRISKLFAAADEYQIDSLKDRCAGRLLSLISSSNVCEILLLAYKHGDEEMKKIAKHFICENPRKVLNSDGWDVLMENTLQRSLTSSTPWRNSRLMSRAKKELTQVREVISAARKSISFRKRAT